MSIGILEKAIKMKTKIEDDRGPSKFQFKGLKEGFARRPDMLKIAVNSCSGKFQDLASVVDHSKHCMT